LLRDVLAHVQRDGDTPLDIADKKHVEYCLPFWYLLLEAAYQAV